MSICSNGQAQDLKHLPIPMRFALDGVPMPHAHATRIEGNIQTHLCFPQFSSEFLERCNRASFSIYIDRGHQRRRNVSSTITNGHANGAQPSAPTIATHILEFDLSVWLAAQRANDWVIIRFKATSVFVEARISFVES